MSKNNKKKNSVMMHLMSGVSYMIPVICAGGLSIGVARILGGYDVGNAIGTLGYMINLIGTTAMGYIVPVLGAAMAYSIAGRPGIAPGLISGALAVSINAGFLGGILGGFVSGYVVLMLIKYIKLPKTMQGLMPIIIIPMCSAIISGLIMLGIIGPPIAALQSALLNVMANLQDGSSAVLGGVIGAMMGFDLGGPVNKTACLFANGLLAEGIYGPTAAKLVGGMIPPLGVALSVFVAKKKYTENEHESAKAAIPMGLCFVTEGVLPFAATDPVRVIAACVAGSSVGGALSMLWGVESYIQAGGIFVVPFMNKPMMFMLALLIGSVVTAVVLTVLKPNEPVVTNTEEVDDDLDLGL